MTTPIRKTFFCVDGHTCGCPVRLVAGGGPQLAGATMSEKRQDFLRALRLDPDRADVRAARPRRHVGLDPLPADHAGRRCGMLFIEMSGCLPMCGHGTIGTVTMALEQGW